MQNFCKHNRKELHSEQFQKTEQFCETFEQMEGQY